MTGEKQIPKVLQTIPTPAYVADETRLRANIALLRQVKEESGAKILYAIKACPLYPVFPLMAQTLDGSTASGLYEARLGREEFGKEIHVFCPAYTDEEVAGLMALGKPVHFYFNSVRQLETFAPRIREAEAGHEIGIRINPRLSVTKHEKYNPCRRGSHLGVPPEMLESVPWDMVDVLHAHALCENMAGDSALLIGQVAAIAGDFVKKVRAVNFGGGHFITHPDYKIDVLLAALRGFRKKFPGVTTILEPGAATVLNAGYLVASVIDVMENDGVKSAILDSSPNCHVPDVMKAGVRLDIHGADMAGKKAHTYTLTGRTCMARDVWGDYSFDEELRPGSRIVFMDALQYSLGEANWFNGHPRPSLGIINENGTHTAFRSYGYDQFRENCG